MLLSVPGEKYKLDVQLLPVGNRLEVHFPFSRAMISEVKAMEEAKWHGFEDPPKKVWTIKNSARNRFVLNWMSGINVFERYDLPLITQLKAVYEGLYKHQDEAARFILTRRRCILAGEMGVGKTRAALVAMLESGVENWIWVGTKASIKAVRYELNKWRFPTDVVITFVTYDQLRKTVNAWPDDKLTPQGVIFDESSRIKNPTSQRSEAAKILSDTMADDWQGEEYVVLMSGAPAPKDPTDWWHQCEVAKQGFLKESNVSKLKARLCLLKEGASASGGVFKEIVTWLDNDKKCAICGKLDSDLCHQSSVFAEGGEDVHAWQKTENQVKQLYERMRGLVLVQFKRDVLKELPEKRYDKINLKPTPATLRTAKTLARTAKSVIVGMTLLRELSDGFQYAEEPDGTKTCPKCSGTCGIEEWFDPKEPETPIFDKHLQDGGTLEKRNAACDLCEGKGQVTKYKDVTREVETPKDEALRDLMELHEDVGRLVVYAGYTGSVDRIVRLAHAEGWDTIRVDGRGWLAQDHLTKIVLEETDHIKLFQEMKEKYPKVLFVAQGGSAGMGLTLTASPSIVYWSNTFNADDRIQSEDRIHRPGMDLNRGATIYDLIHLPTDQFVLDNLQKKRDLQAITMGDFKSITENIEQTERVI